MDTHNDPVMNKFADARVLLESKSMYSVVSIKSKCLITRSEYLQCLEQCTSIESGLHIDQENSTIDKFTRIIGNTCSENMLLVEHDTDQKTISIWGDLTSILELVPFINSVWHYLAEKRDNKGSFTPKMGCRVEICSINSNNDKVVCEVVNFDDFVLSSELKSIIAKFTQNR